MNLETLNFIELSELHKKELDKGNKKTADKIYKYMKYYYPDYVE